MKDPYHCTAEVAHIIMFGVAVSMVDRFSYSYGPASYHCGHRLTSNYSHGSASSLADFYKYSPLVYLYIVIK